MSGSFSLSKTGVRVFDDFRDNLVVDREEAGLLSKRKQLQMASEHSEDAVTWNIFHYLMKLRPRDWFPRVFSAAFAREGVPSADGLSISLWRRIDPPAALRNQEGSSEVDVILETAEWVWIVEAKLGSRVSPRTTKNTTRDQLLRNADVGADYAVIQGHARRLYVSLLLRSAEDSPGAVELVRGYSEDPAKLTAALGHRPSGIPYLRGISILYWRDLIRSIEGVVGSGRLEPGLVRLGHELLEWCGDRGLRA